MTWLFMYAWHDSLIWDTKSHDSLYLTWRMHTWHDSHWTWLTHMWHDSFYLTWLLHMWHESCLTWLIHMWHYSLYLTWLVHMWHDSFICDMTHIWHHSFVRDITRSCLTWINHMWHDSSFHMMTWLFICGIWYHRQHITSASPMEGSRTAAPDSTPICRAACSVIPRMKESCHVWWSHVTYVNWSCRIRRRIQR